MAAATATVLAAITAAAAVGTATYTVVSSESARADAKEKLAEDKKKQQSLIDAQTRDKKNREAADQAARENKAIQEGQKARLAGAASKSTLSTQPVATPTGESVVLGYTAGTGTKEILGG